MAIWQVNEAKTRFRELIDAARVGPQIIRRRGRDVAVVISVDAWRATQPTMTDLLLSEDAKGDWLEASSVGEIGVIAADLDQR